MRIERVLLIDDTRDESSPNIKRSLDLIARNYWSGIDALTKMGPWQTLLLDHDLNSFDETGTTEYTGYTIVSFLEKHPEFLPKEIILVTSNPAGRLRMQAVLDKLYKK